MFRLRIPSMAGLLAALLIVPLVGDLLPASARAGKKKKPKEVELSAWIEGPIRYLTLKEEARQFKQLDDDPSRGLFIERFWARRDPSPETLTNEYRELFWERVRHANDNFIDSPKPGWKTDRGKIYILYGAPTEVTSDLHLATQGLAASGVGLIRWVYEGRPGQRMDLNPIVVVPFVRDASGEYRISYDPDLSSVFFSAAKIREGWDDKFDRYYEMMGAPRKSALSVMLDLGRMQEIPPQAQVLLEQIETTERYEALALPVRIDQYVEPDARVPLSVVSVDLSEFGEGVQPAILARFESDDPDVETRMLGEDSFRFEQGASSKVAQGRIRLDPGQYELTVVVAEPIEVKTGVHKGRIDVRPTSSRLRLSDTVWATELEPVEFASLATHDEPFVVGPYRVIPKLESSYRRGETLKLFFEVYGASGALEIKYQLEGQDEDGSWVQLGQPSVARREGTAQAWSLDTNERWPLGEYRVRVEVLDTEGRLVTVQVPFRLDAPEAS